MNKTGTRPLATLRATLWACLVVTVCTAATELEAAQPSKLTATCYGAAGQVSGSLHVLDTGNGQWMIDCGSEMDRNRAGPNAEEGFAEGQEEDALPQTLPAGAESVAAVFLTHAHTDHIGRLPLLVERGFSGPIYATEATAALAEPMLRVLLQCDRSPERQWTWSKKRRTTAETKHKSLYIHWRDCKYREEIIGDNVEQATCSAQALFDRFSGQTPPVKVTICHECICNQVAATLRNIRLVKYGEPTDVAPGVRATFLDAGHIPGSASVLFEVALGDKKRRVLFSGDLGNRLSPVLAGPKPAPNADVVFVEATYGPISRKPAVYQQQAEFRRTVAEAVGQGGVTWIPCFALDRTQKIFYELHLAQQEKGLPERVPIYCPSPTAREITELYNANRAGGWFSPAIAADVGAFSPNAVFGTVPSSKRLPRPCIIVSTGDVVVAQWMRRLLGTLLPEPSTNIFLVGYQPAGSAGERLLRGANELEVDGQMVPVRAKIHSFSCFSGHADASEIDAWLAPVSKQSTIVLIHGDPKELNDRAEQLRGQGRKHVIIAKPEETLQLE